jgi:hypothetical protein
VQVDLENKAEHLQINLTSFSTIGSTHLRRDISADSLDAAALTSDITSVGSNVVSSAETGVAQASAAAQTAATEVNNSVQEIANNLRSNLPGYYLVGLLGYCEGHSDKPTYCSDPSASFFFNITDIFQEASPEVSSLIPGIGSKALLGYQAIARWSISANILGLIFSFASVIFGITILTISSGKMFLVICLLVRLYMSPAELVDILTVVQMATVFITAATISTTVIYSLMTGAIEAILQDFGISASFGMRTFIAAWLGVVFSFGALLTCMIELFCCCI